jgi:hypothetical protein
MKPAKPPKFTAIAEQAFANGYTPIPCNGKRPIAEGWQHTPHTQEALAANLSKYPWAANTGLLAGEIAVVDIDCTSEPITRAVVRFIQGHIPGGNAAPIRFGKGYKVAMLFRADRPQGKRQTASWDIGGEPHKLEILGIGQQFIAYGIHPDTRHPYRWKGDIGPHNVPIEQLPVLTNQHVEDLFNEFVFNILPRDAMQLSTGSSTGTGTGADINLSDPFANTKPPRDDITLADAERALQHVEDNISHENWIRIGQALAHQFNGAEEALHLWDDWSATAPNYAGPDECRRRWDSFKASGYSGTVTIGSLLHQARQAGYTPTVEIEGLRMTETTADNPLAGFAPVTPPAATPSSGADTESKPAKPSVDHILFGSPVPWVEPDCIPARRKIYGKTLMRRYVTAMVSPGGIGKSTYGLHIAASIATGRPLMGERVHRQGKVLLINYEDDAEEMQRRLAALTLHHNVSREELSDNLVMQSWLGLQAYVAFDDGIKIHHTEALKRLLAYVKRENVVAVVIDPFVATHNAPENDNTKINAVMTAFKHLALEGDCAVVLVHHTSKGSGKDTEAHAGSGDASRGASALKDAARGMITLARMSEASMDTFGIPPELGKFLVRMDTAKSNYAPPDASATWFKLVSVALYNHRAELDETEDEMDWVGALEPFDLEGWVGENRDERSDEKGQQRVQILAVAESGMNLTEASRRMMSIWDCSLRTAIDRVQRLVPSGAERAITVDTFHGSKTVYLEGGGKGNPVVFRIF